MTSKELVTKAIRFEEVPRVPVAMLDGYLWMLKQNNMSLQQLFDMKPEESGQFILDYYDRVGSDIIYANGQAGSAQKIAMGGSADYTAVAAPPAIKGTALAEPGDIKQFSVSKVFEDTINHPVFKNLSAQLDYMSNKAGDEKYIFAFSVGPLTGCAGLMGMENLMMALMEEDDALKYVLEFSVESTIKMVEHQLANGASGISIADPLSSINLISEEIFEKYSLPYTKQIVDELSSKHAPVMLHICGDTTVRLDPVKQIGVDIFSVDAVDLKSSLETARGNYAIFGNLNTVSVMLQGDPESVAKEAEERLAIAGKNGGFILAPGCDLPPDTPMENILAMTNSVGR